MKQALKELIDDLVKVDEEHEEVTDTDVREEMFTAIHQAFIEPKDKFKLPNDFAMFSPKGNKKVKEALQRFLSNPEVQTAAKELKRPQERLDAFQDLSVEGSNGYTYDEFFGYADSP